MLLYAHAALDRYATTPGDLKPLRQGGHSKTPGHFLTVGLHGPA